jgi:hypothetical protein
MRKRVRETTDGGLGIYIMKKGESERDGGFPRLREYIAIFKLEDHR